MAKYNKKWTYNMEDDYGTMAYEAAQAGNMQQAEDLERTRNYKIDQEKLPYAKTYNYIDLGTDIKDAMANGESAALVKGLTLERENKIHNNSELGKYYDDEIQRSAKNYYNNELAGAGGNYQNRPQYNEVYTKEVDDLVQSILGREEFEYSAEDDPSYQAYKEAALREGQRAMQNTLTNYSQMAGGMNSYAVSAAQQAMNNHLAQLNDKIPELYQQAYDRYLNEYAQDKDDLNTLLNIQSMNYDKYLNDYGIYDNDRRFGTSEAQREIDNAYRQRVRQTEDERYIDERDYERAKAEEARNADLADKMLVAGGMPTDEMLAAAGFDPAYAQTLSSYYVPRNEYELEGARLANEGQSISNQIGYKDLQWYDAKARKSLSGGSKSSSSANSKTLKAAADYINDIYGEDIVIDKGNGKYGVRVSGDSRKNAVKELADSGVYSQDEILSILGSFGMSEEEIDKNLVWYAEEVEKRKK